ncbi:MAG: class I SAM-dependent methyltransferase [Steroidobacteraceae bacterium]
MERRPKAQRMPTRLSFMSALAATFLALADCATAPTAPAHVDPALSAAVASPVRLPAAIARDPVRHPVEELTFFGLAPTQTVVELWPGGGYWTDILGPYLALHGHFYVALPAPGDTDEDASVVRWRARFTAQPDHYGPIIQTTLGPGQFDIAPPGSADLVLTFRNLHNWMDGGYASQALAACFRALKPGGIFGIEEHRGRTDRPQDPEAKNGYVRQDYTITLAQQAGFELIGSSEILANPRDTKDWVDGVWTLPPTLSQGNKDRERYIAVGEADNFLLKFRKPRH